MQGNSVRISISNDMFDNRFKVKVSNLTKEQARKMATFGQDFLLGEPVTQPKPGYATLYGRDRDEQEALILAARLHFNHAGANKIMSIKFVRTLTYISLQEAKELVDFAIGHSYGPPVWLTPRAA
jgi:ribosomal protein L7/L12